MVFVTTGFCQSIEDIIDQSATKPDSRKNIAGTQLPVPVNPDENITSNAPVTYALQLGTFILENDANKQVIELKQKGFEPYIFQSVNSKNQTLFTVRIGNYGSAEEAQKALSKLAPKLDYPIFISRYDSLLPVGKKAGTTVAGSKTNTAEKVSPAIVSSTAGSDKSVEDRLKSLEKEIRRLQDEADIRQKLSATANEKKASESSEDILESAGLEYTLTREGNLRFSYGLSYSYSNYDVIRAGSRVEDSSNHTISNSFAISYGLKDNFNLSTSVPFVYKYYHIGTVDSKSTTGIGDMSLNWSWQPIKPTPVLPTIIVNGGFRIPSGRSPYEINVDEDMSTGSGIYSTSLGVSLSRVSDPVVVFSSFSASYPFSVTGINQKRTEGVLQKVNPGMGLGLGCGMGYSLSYRLYLNMSFSYSYSFETEYFYENASPAKSGTSTSASIGLGVGYKYSPRQNLNFSIGIPLTNKTGFSVSFSTPIEFEM